MSKEKNFRVDGTYLITTDSTCNPKLGAKVLKNGTESLFLDYYLGYEKVFSKDKNKEIARIKRKREYLKLYLLRNPKNAIEREQNKVSMATALKIRDNKDREIKEQSTGFSFVTDNRKTNILAYFQNYIDNYAKKDVRVLRMALRNFKRFLAELPEYRQFANELRPNQMDSRMIQEFVYYLQDNCKGYGADTNYKRFKKMVNDALANNILRTNPCKRPDGTAITIEVEDNLVKDVLTEDEMARMLSTHYEGENPVIRKAFIFSLYTGLRFCDVKAITFGAIDYQSSTFTIEQNKTKGHSKSSKVTTPLTGELLAMVGKPQTDNPDAELIFKLPSSTMCLKALKHWTKRAGIEKHITWHCARHSFATAILRHGANIETTAKMLGHSGLKYVEVYVRALAEDKKAAIDTLPKIELG